MAPRRSLPPLLSELNPNKIAREVLTAIAAKVRELGNLLHLPLTAAGGDVSDRVVELVVWAKEGWPGHRSSGEAALRQIERALYGRPVDPPTKDPVTFRKRQASLLNVKTPIGVAIGAARARLWLTAGHPVSMPEMMALTGLSRKAIQRLILTQKLEQLPDGRIGALSALQWLGGRVKGFEPPKTPPVRRRSRTKQ